MTGKPTPAHDPTVLRAIAHPVRNRILAELFASGPMRAADVAQELDIPANQASFHLRQLAKYGLVEEDPEAARDRRDRVWRLTSTEGLTFKLKDIARQPGGDAAVGVFRRHAASWAHAVVDQAYAEPSDDGPYKSASDFALRLTEDEAERLTLELTELMDRWSRNTRGRDEARRTYLLLQLLLPYPERQTREEG